MRSACLSTRDEVTGSSLSPDWLDGLVRSARELTYERVDLVVVAGMVVQTYRTLSETEGVVPQFDPPGTACVGLFDREGEARMFEAFAQYDGSNGQSARGAGIGLTIVRGLVDLMGGTIDVDSKRGEGTTITIRLPME